MTARKATTKDQLDRGGESEQGETGTPPRHATEDLDKITRRWPS